MSRNLLLALALSACSAPAPTEPTSPPIATPPCSCGGVLEVELSANVPQTTWRIDPPARIVQFVQGVDAMGMHRATYPLTAETLSQDGRLIYTPQPTPFLHIRYLW